MPLSLKGDIGNKVAERGAEVVTKEFDEATLIAATKCTLNAANIAITRCSPSRS